MSLQKRYRRDVGSLVESALTAQRHQTWTPLDLESLKARHERKRLAAIPKTPVRARVYLPPLGSLARQLLGAREITRE